MQLATDTVLSTPIPHKNFLETMTDLPVAQQDFSQYKVIRRNGAVVAFEPIKISIAMTKAFIAVRGGQSAVSSSMREIVARLTNEVVHALTRRRPGGGTFHIEDIQDQVELALMRSGDHDVARAYVLYREERARERARQLKEQTATTQTPVLHIVENGQRIPLDSVRLTTRIQSACQQLGEVVSAELIVKAMLRDLYDGVPAEEVRKSAILSARALIEQEPAYSFVTARLLLDDIRYEVLGEDVSHEAMQSRYADYFPGFIQQGIEAGLLDERLGQFDLVRLSETLVADRDLQFGYLGLQTLYDRYFLHISERRIELPQAFFMRVAMGLALNEIDREARAIEFYHLLSKFDFMSSTPDRKSVV